MGCQVSQLLLLLLLTKVVSQMQDDLPIQFLRSLRPFDAEVIIGSFGSSVAYRGTAFSLQIERNTAAPIPSPEVERYGKLKEIRHIFSPSAKSPPIIVTLVFVVVVLAASPILAGIVRLEPSRSYLVLFR